MIPVIVAEEDTGLQWPATKFLAQGISQNTEPRATVENEQLVSGADFNTRRVSAVAQVLPLGSRRGTAHAPEAHKHQPASGMGVNFFLPILAQSPGQRYPMALFMQPFANPCI
jgi:hypothetical protein